MDQWPHLDAVFISQVDAEIGLLIALIDPAQAGQQTVLWVAVKIDHLPQASF